VSTQVLGRLVFWGTETGWFGFFARRLEDLQGGFLSAPGIK
jgi:hypothetical protein